MIQVVSYKFSMFCSNLNFVFSTEYSNIGLVMSPYVLGKGCKLAEGRKFTWRWLWWKPDLRLFHQTCWGISFPSHAFNFIIFHSKILYVSHHSILIAKTEKNREEPELLAALHANHSVYYNFMLEVRTSTLEASHSFCHSLLGTEGMARCNLRKSTTTELHSNHLIFWRQNLAQFPKLGLNLNLHIPSSYDYRYVLFIDL